MFGHLFTVVVGGYLSMILGSDFRKSQTLCIIANSQYQLVCHQTLRNQVECHSFRHFTYHHTGFLKIVWLLQHLSAAEGVGLRTICLYRLHRTRFPSPSMVYQQFCIHAKEPVKQSFVVYRHPCQFAHCVDTIYSQFLCYSASYPPELGQRSVVPSENGCVTGKKTVKPAEPCWLPTA